jgi:hypothetical protein
MGQKEMAMTGKNRIMSTGRRMTAPTSSNSRRPRARRWRSACRLERPACSSISSSVCHNGLFVPDVGTG